jgi:exonuclease SbcD
VPFRFLHAADLHLDTPFEGLTAVRPDLGALLREASLLALDALATAAVEHEVDFVVLAGDLYDGAERGLRAQLRMRAFTERLAGHGIRTFLVHGNHDPTEEGWSSITAWPQQVHVFAADRVEAVALDLRGQAVTVYGTSYPRREVRESLVPRFPRPCTPGFHLAILHANVGATTGHAAYSPCTIEDLAAVGMDYWALGHIHRGAVLRARGPRIVYPGNLQGRSFKPSERGAKGAVLVTVDGDRIDSATLDLAPVRFEEAELDVGPCVDLADVVARLHGLAHALRCPGKQLLVRGRLVGSTELWEDLVHPGSDADLLADLRSQAANDLWWADLRMDARPLVDFEAWRGRDDLRGELVAVADEMRRSPLEIRRLLSREAPTADLVRDLDDAALVDLLDRAVREAAIRLSTEED